MLMLPHKSQQEWIDTSGEKIKRRRVFQIRGGLGYTVACYVTLFDKNKKKGYVTLSEKRQYIDVFGKVFKKKTPIKLAVSHRQQIFKSTYADKEHEKTFVPLNQWPLLIKML